MAHCRQKERRRDCQDTFALAEEGFPFGDFIICADENMTIALTLAEQHGAQT